MTTKESGGQALGDERDRLLDVAVLLELDVDEQPPRGRVEHVGQQRGLAGPHPRLELGVGEAAHGLPSHAGRRGPPPVCPSAVRRTSISMPSQPSSAAPAHRRQRVLRRLVPRAPVGEDERTAGPVAPPGPAAVAPWVIAGAHASWVRGADAGGCLSSAAHGRTRSRLLPRSSWPTSWPPAGCPPYGHSIVQAPHLSALAEAGTVFESAYTAFPLCAPARAAMLTGRYASRVGVYDNAAEFRAGAPTVVHALRAAGYHTAVSGKMHFVGPDQLHGFEDRLTTDIYPADVDWTPDWSRPLEDPLPWYHTMESVLAPGICAASMQTDYDDEVAFQAVRKLYEIARHRADQPYFLFVSFTNPHDPWEIPQRFWDRYRRDDIDDPAVPIAAARRGRSPQPAAARDVPGGPGRADRRADPPRPPRLLRGHQLPGRAHRPGAGRAARVGPGGPHHGSVLRRPRRDAGRAGPLVQDELPGAVGAGAADRARAGWGRSLSGARVARAGVAGRTSRPRCSSWPDCRSTRSRERATE